MQSIRYKGNAVQEVVKVLVNKGNLEMTLACSPEVNTYMSDRIKVVEYHAMYINFPKLVKEKI